MMDPAYTCTVPSVLDGLPLSCRIFHPEGLETNLHSSDKILKGAIVAHPYAPLGGCYDDPVVVSVTESLLQQGYIVGTFNFRGAGNSGGSSSWTGKGEIEDYVSFVGFIIFYLQALRTSTDIDDVSSHTLINEWTSNNASSEHQTSNSAIQLLLGGYSFGSLILARLPPVSNIINRFDLSGKGSPYSEIFLRARTLAKHTQQSSTNEPQRTHRRIRSMPGSPSPSRSPRLRASSMTIGGEETNPAGRRHSRESSKGSDLVREIPQRIKTHIRRQSSDARKKSNHQRNTSGVDKQLRAIDVRYLMISPVLIPFTTTLSPPGLPFSWPRMTNAAHQPVEIDCGLMSLASPTLAVFGSTDSFTSGRKLQEWAQKLSKSSNELFEWEMIDEAGHFWREEGSMRAMKESVTTWITKIDQKSCS